MKRLLAKNLSIVTIFSVISISAAVRAETADTRIGKLNFQLGVPTQETVIKLYDEMDFQRACQVYLWALPIVNAARATLWVDFAADAHDGDAVICEGYRNLSGVLTPNV